MRHSYSRFSSFWRWSTPIFSHVFMYKKTITTSETLSRLFLFFSFFSHNFVFTSGFVFFVVFVVSCRQQHKFCLVWIYGCSFFSDCPIIFVFLNSFCSTAARPIIFSPRTLYTATSVAWRLACAMRHTHLREQRGKFRPTNKVLLRMKLYYFVLFVIELWNIIK